MPFGSSFMRSPTISAFPAHAGDTRADQGLVADELERKADQDRREGASNGEVWLVNWPRVTDGTAMAVRPAAPLSAPKGHSGA
jgi:hypothetical protein